MKLTAPRVRGSGAKGFSLIELLVVIGIIILMIGALGLALRGGSGNATLQSAQGTVASMVAATRAQAALNQSPAYLAVDADPASDTFLRGLHVVIADSGSGTWKSVSDTTLPAGVGFVPATGFNPAAISLAAGWPSAHTSALQTATVTVNGQPAPCILSTFSFDATGRFNSASANGGGDKLVLSNCHQTAPSAWLFDNAQAVRGVTLSAYGATILINDATGFDN